MLREMTGWDCNGPELMTIPPALQAGVSVDGLFEGDFADAVAVFISGTREPELVGVYGSDIDIIIPVPDKVAVMADRYYGILHLYVTGSVQRADGAFHTVIGEKRFSVTGQNQLHGLDHRNVVFQCQCVIRADVKHIQAVFIYMFCLYLT